MKGQGAEECPRWSIHTNGLSNKQAGGAGVVLHSLEGGDVECMVRLDFSTTNNVAEYEALIAGLDFAKAAGAVNVVMYCDSQVVPSQVNSDYKCKGERMRKYLEQVKDRVNDLQAKIFKSRRRRTSTLTIFPRLHQQSICSFLIGYCPSFKSHH